MYLRGAIDALFGAKLTEEATIQKDLLPLILWHKHFYQQQKDFTISPAKQRWFVAGNGCGKSFLTHWNAVAYGLGMHPHQNPVLMRELGLPVFPPPPIRIRILVPEFDKVKEVSLAKLIDPQIIRFAKGDIKGDIEVGPMLPDSLVKPKKGFTKDHKAIELKNGTNFTWVTNEQGWKAMRGPECDIFVMDEENDQRVFDEIYRGLRNAKGGGKVLCGLTPPYEEGCGPTWTKHEIIERASNLANDPADINPSIEVFQACMMDNPAITPQFIKEFSHGKTKEQIQVQVYGEYPTWGDLVHPDFQDSDWDPKAIRGHILPNHTPLPEDYDVDWVMAFDWHPSKPCAAVFGFVDRDGDITIFDELDKDVADRAGDDIDELADIFRSIEGQPHRKRRFRRWQDPSAKTEYNRVKRGFSAWDAFRKAGIITAAGRNRDPLIGISMVNEYFRGNRHDHPRIFIYERCKFTRKYLKNHYWKRDKNGKGVPDGKWSDYPICIRYILQEVGWKQKTKKRTSTWPLQSFQKAANA